MSPARRGRLVRSGAASSFGAADSPGFQAGMLRELLAPRAGAQDPRSVSVVGNAPMAPSAERAAWVDEADLVTRMTTFDIDRAEASVGKRTDVAIIHRATAPGPATFEDYRSRQYLLAEPGRLHWEPERVPLWWPADLGFVPISNSEFVEPLNRLLRFPAEAATWATTGTLAVWLMHRLYPDAEIRLTGTSLLGSDAHRKTSFDHAAGSAVLLTPEHRLGAERRLLLAWKAAGWLQVRST